MRHISTYGKAPDEAWRKKAGELLQAMKDASTNEERHAIIDRNQAFWGQIKEWLLELSHGKCWFSEAKDCFNYWHVEHFRPKKIRQEQRWHGGRRILVAGLRLDQLPHLRRCRQWYMCFERCKCSEMVS